MRRRVIGRALQHLSETLVLVAADAAARCPVREMSTIDQATGAAGRVVLIGAQPVCPPALPASAVSARPKDTAPFSG